MIRKILIPLFLILIGCSSPEPPSSTVKTISPAKPKPEASKPAPNPWAVKNYVDSDGNPSERKYGRYDADGTFSDPSASEGYLHAVILLNKENAGILLSKHKRSNPAQKFNDPVTIKMKNTAGNELELISNRGLNKSGGILIEQNNNDYSQFRIFMLKSEGMVDVTITGDSSSVYLFTINAAGFGDALSQL